MTLPYLSKLGRNGRVFVRKLVPSHLFLIPSYYNLQVNTRLHNEIHFLSLRNAELTEQLNAENTKAAEFENKYEDAEYALSKVSLDFLK